MSRAPRHLVLALSTLWCVRGGIQRFNQLLCRAVDELAPELGVRGTVLSQDDTEADYRASGREWSHLRFLAGGGPRSVAWRTLAHCARVRPELLLIGHVGMTPLGPLCSPFVRGGFGFVAHGTEAWSIPRCSRRFAVRRAARVFAVSEFTAGRLCVASGLDAARVRLLPNALEPGLEAMSDAGDEPAGGGPELLAVARLDADEREKGIDHTIEVLPRLIERHPGVVLRIVGRGTDKPRLVELVRARGLTDRVIFEQDLSDEELVERYGRCAVFVLPSGQEGFGIVFLEAMRFGRPCVGGAAGGTPEVIEDGKTGLLVPFGDPDALERALDRLLADPGLRRSMGRAGLARVHDRFTYPRFRANVETYLADWL